jgi:Ca2+-binding EF-hand superfamily protein
MASNAPYDAQASTNYKEAFALFDKRGNQRVQLESLGDLLRACGQNPTLQEIRELEKNIGSDCQFPCIPSPLLPKSVPDPLPRGERRKC